MARLTELQNARPGWLGRFAYFVARRKLGKVPGPLRVLHRNRGLLLGVGAFETGLERSTRVPPRLKDLASMWVAMQVGCPF